MPYTLEFRGVKMTPHQRTIWRLRERDWSQAFEPLFSSSHPARHVILDEALNPAAFAALRSELLSSYAWHYRSQPGYVLCLSPSDSSVISDVARRLGEILGEFQAGLEACERWAFLHQRPFEEFVHSDVGAYVWTLWLTPEKLDSSPAASTFHSIGPCHFEASTIERMRCSVSIFLDSQGHWQALREIEKVPTETASHDS